MFGAKYYIFDMDGTILDSMVKWYDGGKEAVEKILNIEIKFTNYAELRHTVKRYIKEASEENRTKILDYWYNNMDSYDGVTVKEGVIDFFNKAKSENIHMCLATASSLITVIKVLRKLKIDSYFDFVLTSGIVGKGKTFPDLFLMCADNFNAKPSECVIFEDMLKFTVEPKKLGFKIVGVYDPVHEDTLEEFKANCDKFIYSFKELL